MQSGELHVRIGPRGRDGRCALLIRTFDLDRLPFDFEAPIYIASTAPATPVVSPDVVALIVRYIIAHVEAARSTGIVSSSYLPFRIMLEIEPLDLVGLDWENRFRLASLPPSLIITRFRAVSDMRVVHSFELPLRVLHAPRLTALDTSPTDAAMKYFRYHRVSGISAVDIAPTLRNAVYEVVHLAVEASWTTKGVSELTIESSNSPPEQGIKVAMLNRTLSLCRARLLILQCIGEDCFVPVLNFAHRLLCGGGPSILVLKGATTHYLDGLYMDIVHDQFMPSNLLSWHRPITGIALFHGIGGERVLALRPLAARLLEDMEHTAKAGEKIRESVQAGKPSIRFGGASTVAPAAVADKILAELRTSMVAHSEAAMRVYDYSRESGAWIPLAQNRRAQVRAANQVKALQRSVDRVVNVGFFDVARRNKLDSREMLQPNESYELCVQIGLRTNWSVIDGNAAFPEDAIERYYSSNGVELRVVVFAPSFKVSEPDRNLYIGRPPSESEELRFAARAPADSGRHRIRVCIYRELNLLQAVLIRVSVGVRDEFFKPKRGIEAEVEFALSSTLADVQNLPRRECNFLANAADDGTHMLDVVGSGVPPTRFEFGDGEMRSAVGAARDALYTIAADTSSNPPKYRFDTLSNATTVKRLEEDLIRLAELGFQLYSNIITGKDRRFADTLRKSLGSAGATIQVAAVKSARYVFPWSLVYDHPLVTGSLKLCPQFAAALISTPAQPLSTHVCLAQGCPNRGKTDIVCPSGFWGFKHYIEQPLSVDTEPNSSGRRDLILEIDGGPPGMDITALMLVSRELKEVAAHEKELRSPSSFAFLVRDTKVEASECLQDAKRASHLIYFYCHGGREKARTWLGIGVKERLIPSDLTGLQIDWTDIHPLVFINGCHTADFTADDLLNFNQVLTYCRAAGVIGTEISVPESLARFFASGFLLQFRNGSTVGAAIREQRLELLKRCNLLGLCYTPYCSVNLKIVQH